MSTHSSGSTSNLSSPARHPPDLLSQHEDLHLSPVRPRLRLIQPQFGDANYLRSGETIALVYNDVWCKAILQSNTGRKRVKNKSLYWNYKLIDDSIETGGYLFPGQAWG